LQYRWIGEVSQAERERLREALRTSLSRLGQQFNAELTTAVTRVVADLGPSPGGAVEPVQLPPLIKSVSLVSAQGERAVFRRLDPVKGSFVEAEWPGEWGELRAYLEARIAGNSGPPFGREPATVGGGAANVIELPLLPWEPDMQRGPPLLGEPPQRLPMRRITGWCLSEVDVDYIRSTMIPSLVLQHLGENASSEYYAEVVAVEEPGRVVYQLDPAERVGRKPDAAVRLFEVRVEPRGRGPMGRGGRFDRPGAGDRRGLPDFDRGRWLLSVRHRSGSLETVVQRARMRNLAVTGGALALIVAAGAMLLRFTRRSQRLAGLQMQFVAGVSHELRTPLTVMRTAGHNLQGNVALDPSRVRRYGALIADQSEKLGAIVEQVLRFANVKAGRVIGMRQKVDPGAVIDAAIEGSRSAIAEAGCAVERDIAADLPAVLADAVTLQHALQNLIENAAKYGKSGGWVGIEAKPAAGGVEIRIRDRGPGIPAQEIAQVFDPFYRGKRPVDDQIHGTGLGLTLAKRIVEAHGGTITVVSEAERGTDVVVRLAANGVEEDGDKSPAD
jgi:signal transduction histidine kinase